MEQPVKACESVARAMWMPAVTGRLMVATCASGKNPSPVKLLVVAIQVAHMQLLEIL